MTSGDASVTNGKHRFRPGPWGAIAAVAIPVVVVNATSVMMEHSHVHPVEPFLWEGSSAIVLVLLAPIIGWASRRWPLDGQGLWTSIAVHAALTLPFSLVHIIGMLAIRMGAYAAFGHTYEYFGDSIPLKFLYEWRKDVITYTIFLAVYAGAAWLAGRQVDSTPPPARIEIRDGGKTLFLIPGEIQFLEAAGNYVEIHTANGRHLVRGTLAAWERKLSANGFARIHRSRLVNRAHVAALTPTGSGDFEVTLSSGKSLQGSRRFRSSLA